MLSDSGTDHFGHANFPVQFESGQWQQRIGVDVEMFSGIRDSFSVPVDQIPAADCEQSGDLA
jgi:hypothetical protein